MTEPDVIIVGGGLHGCSAAFHLAQHGLKPLVLERSTVARHASSASAGGVRRLGRDPAEIPLAVASSELWHRLGEMLGDDGEFRASGQVRIAETAADMAQAVERHRLVTGLGYDHERLIDRDELRRLVPAVAPTAVGGLHVAGDGYAFPYKTTMAFRHAAERLGAEIREGTGVTAVERANNGWTVVTSRGRFSAPVLVNCAGAWGGQLAALLGDRVPLEPQALMMMVTARLPHFIDPTVGVIGRKLSFKQSQNGTVVIGGGHRGTVVPEDETTVLDFARLAESAATVGDVFPIMRAAPITRCWAGIEGFTPDDLPIIGPSPTAPGVYHSFGFCGHGFQLGPIVGAITAELIRNGRTNLPIAPFRVDRFGT